MTLSHLWLSSGLLCVLLSGAASGSEKAAKSSFTASKIPRDPFVRIDASHLANKAQVVFAIEEDENAPGKLFRVTGISKASLAIALINGKAFAEKDTFTVKARDKELRVTLLKVNEDGVELEFGGKVVSVPMVREALSSEAESG